MQYLVTINAARNSHLDTLMKAIEGVLAAALPLTPVVIEPIGALQLPLPLTTPEAVATLPAFTVEATNGTATAAAPSAPALNAPYYDLFTGV
jgi:hypothetical protein